MTFVLVCLEHGQASVHHVLNSSMTDRRRRLNNVRLSLSHSSPDNSMLLSRSFVRRSLRSIFLACQQHRDARFIAWFLCIALPPLSLLSELVIQLMKE